MNSDVPGRHGKHLNVDFLAKFIVKTLNKLPPKFRGHLVAVIGEFVGTALFLGFAFAGTQVANVSSNTNTGTTVITTTIQKTPQQLLYISLSFGFALAVNAWVFFRVSGGLFNPAVTVGMWMIGAIDLVRAILLFITQIVGGIAAAAAVSGLFTGGLNVSTSLSSTTTQAQGVLIEMILTLQLVFTIFMLAAEKHTGNFIAPIGIGLSLFISELVGVFWTGGSLNPARSFGPAVVTRSFGSDHWVYWVGPLAGTVLAVLLYKLIKGLEYESVNKVEDVEAAVVDKVVSNHAELGPAPPGPHETKDIETTRSHASEGTLVDAHRANDRGRHIDDRLDPRGTHHPVDYQYSHGAGGVVNSMNNGHSDARSREYSTSGTTIVQTQHA